MDDVLCDFKGAVRKRMEAVPRQKFPQAQYGFFLDLEPLPNAIGVFKQLQEKYDIWILTKPSIENINCYSEKAKWVLDHLGKEAQEHLIICNDKSLVKGDYLIDDAINAGQLEFEGTLIRFGSEEFPDWITIWTHFITFSDER